MLLEPGTHLGAYKVIAQIGQGGMGIVYRARDTTLNRDVAIKVLPDAFASDPERLARFEREAKVLALLNHPNIAAIYGLEQSGDTRALVLELVEGPTLAEMLQAPGSRLQALGPPAGPEPGVRSPKPGTAPTQAKALPINEALAIARQIAEALEAAHEQGVIHRDLKPANVKVKPDGMVKVLDFGLAKALEGEAGTDPSQSPTMTAAATRAGVIMGTAAYMSPEQARGKPVDKRADIWAFGAVLFEMLTGRRAFQGEDVSHVMAKVIDRDPDFGVLPGDTPAVVRKLLSRCLEKNPKQRVRDIGDLRLAMEGAFETIVTEPSEAAARPEVRVWQRAMPLVLAGVLVAVISGLAVWTVMRPDPPPSGAVTRFPLVLPSGDQFSAARRHVLAVSPDGTHLVYVANDQLYLRAMDQMAATPIRGTGGSPGRHGRSPFFSADGQWIGFWAEGQLKKVSVSGGAPVTLCDADSPLGASWGADDTILFGQGPAGIWQVPGTGGAAEVLIAVEEGEQGQSPQMLPGGEWVLFTLRPSRAVSWDDSQIVVQSLASGERRVLVNGGKDGRYLPTGHLVYALEGTLLAVPFDADELAIAPGPVPLVESVGDARNFSGAAHFDLSEAGSLVYVPGGAGAGGTRTLLWVDRTGQEELLPTPPYDYRVARLSPDGTRLAIDRADDGGNLDVWTSDLARGTFSRLTTDSGMDATPLWSVDGQRVVFTSDREGALGLFSKAADGTGPVEPLIETPEATVLVAYDWSADGNTLVFVHVSASSGADIGIVSLEGEREWQFLIQTDFNDGNPAVSPDGRWLAYMSDETGQYEVYVQRFPDLGERQQVSVGGGRGPQWSPSGQELFYRRLDGGAMMVVPVSATETALTMGTRDVLFEGSYVFSGPSRNYDVAPDAQRFLMLKPGAATDESASAPQINVVLNWFEELRARVPIP